MNSHLILLGPALANHLWQSTAFGLLAWLITLTLRRNQARVRYAVWLGASIKFLIPFSLLIAAGNLLPHPKRPVTPVVYSAMDIVEEPFGTDAQQVIDAPVHVPTVRERVEAALPVCLGTLWLTGVGTVLFAWCNRWRVVSRSVRQALPATRGREFEILRRLDCGSVPTLPLLMSAERMEPGIFGVFRPVLVWPAHLSVYLDDRHIEAIIAHELTHVRRRDNLAAVMHMFVEAIFWFHPLVWWMERKMVKERERACDEAVVEMGGSAETYAESLLKTCWFCIESPLPCVAGVTGAELKRRVADIITGRALLRMTWPRKLLLAVVVVSALLAPVVLGQAKATQRLMRSAINIAPEPVQQIAAHAMRTEDETLVTGEASETSMSPAQDPTAHAPFSGPSFEVATIRPRDEKNGPSWFGFRVIPSGRLIVSGVPLTGLVGFTSIFSGQVSGGPAWADSQKWDVVAEADISKIPNWNQLSDEERWNRFKPMLRKLVTERFHLKLHTENRLYDVYAMVPAKHGMKLGGALKRADPPPAHTDPQEMDARLRSNKPPTEPPVEGYTMSPDGTWWFRSVPPKFLAPQLAANCRIDGRVVDQSGLQGYYDLTFKPDRDPDAPSLQDQVEMQLGLKFEPKKIPLPTYVIDSAEKPSLDGADVQATTNSGSTAMMQGKPPHDQALPNTSLSLTAMHDGATQDSRQRVVPTFEVVSIERYVSPPLGPVGSFVVRRLECNYAIDRVKCDLTPRELIQEAFTLKKMQIKGPPSLDEHIYALEGTMPPGTDKKTARLMLQTSLIERFDLKYHYEERKTAAYVLEPTTPGATLVAASPPEAREKEKIVDPAPTSTGPPRSTIIRAGRYYSTAMSLGTLAQNMEFSLDLPVIDNSGTTGEYKFDLEWPPSEGFEYSAHPLSDAEFLRELRVKYGLRLDKRNVAIKTLVADHISDTPSVN